MHQPYCPPWPRGDGTRDKTAGVQAAGPPHLSYCFINKAVGWFFYWGLDLGFFLVGWVELLFSLGFVYTYKLENLLIIIA